VNDSQKLIGAFFIGLTVAAVAGLAFHSGSSKTTPKSLTTSKEIPFRSLPNASPYIATDSVHSSPNIDQLDVQKEMALQQAAIQMAIDKQKELEKRLQSSQIVFDLSMPNEGLAPSEGSMPGEASAQNAVSSSSTATASQAPFQATVAGGTIPNNGTATALSGTPGSSANAGDPNLAFAAQNADKSVETAQASQLLNLHTLIAQGAMIPGILETAIESDLPGMTRAVVSENIYSFDGFELLIPEGSRLIGQYRSGLVNGQSRVFIIWTRLIRNDGVSINVGSYGTDALGRSGLAGDVDTHFFERFGSSVMLSMIDSGLQAAANANNKTSTAVAVNTGNDFSNAAAIALQNSINIPPTINIDQGTRINVFVGKDLDFSKVGGIKQAEAEQPAEGQDAE
jgi:type IV secretory pathway VirB10-like protein